MIKFSKTAAVTFLCVLFLSNSNAQKNDIVLTWNPFSFIEPDAGFTPGIEYMIGKKISLLTDAGIIFYDVFENSRSNNNIINTEIGYKIKPEFRYYPKYSEVAKGFFLSAEGLYKHVTYKRYDGVRVFDNMGNQVYIDYNGYKIIKDVFGGSIKLGWRFYFTKTNSFGLDIYAGLGIKNKNFAIRDLPPGGSFDRNFFAARLFNTQWQPGATVSMPAGMKLIWRVKKAK